MVLLGFFVRDYSRNTLWFRDYAKPRFVPEHGSLKLVGSPVIPPEQLFEEYVTGRRKIGAGVRSYALGALARFQRALRDRTVTAQSEGALVLSGIMARFAAEVRAAGATPLWMIIPDRDVLGRRARHEPIERLCEQYAAAIRLPCLSLSKIFRDWAQAHPDQKIYQGRETGGHLSPAGNRLVAEEIRRFLVREGVLKSDG
ncbi:MAG: hypothetical protein N2689_16280 [Verrucomicrobiae bacterium]|nr:hypothetical protein [Verrucomicrobiae bacterium]